MTFNGFTSAAGMRLIPEPLSVRKPELTEPYASGPLRSTSRKPERNSISRDYYEPESRYQEADRVYASSSDMSPSARHRSATLHKLTDELHAARTAWRSECQGLRERMASLHDGKCRAEEELHRVQDTYTAYQRTTNMKVNQLERKIAELTQALHSRDSALQSMESKYKLNLQSASTQCDEMLSQVEKAETNNREMAAIIVQLRSELATANEHLARCRADLAEKARLSEDLHAQLMTQQSQAASAAVSAAEARAESISRISTLEQSTQLLKQQLEQQKIAYETQLHAHREEKAFMETRLKHMQEESQLKLRVLSSESAARVEQLQQEVARLSRALEDQRIANRALNEALHTAEAEFAGLAETAESMAPRGGGSVSGGGRRAVVKRAVDDRRLSVGSDDTVDIPGPVGAALRNVLEQQQQQHRRR